MLIFTAVFGRMAKMPSDGIWYPVFVLTALLPWTYFAQALTRSGSSLVRNANLVKKVYFTRIFIPLSAIITPLIDFVLSLVLLFGLLLYAGIPLRWKVLTLPLFMLVSMLTATGVGLILTTANVKYRDVGHAVPFVIQIWMFLSPIVYPVSLVPERWQVLYGLNPMVGVLEGFRWALLGKAAPDPLVMGASFIVLMGVLVGGFAYFRKMERDFADVI